MSRLAILVILAWGFASTVSGAALSREQVDAIVRPAAEVARLDRVAVGTIDSSGRTFAGYAQSGSPPPDGRTMFEIGSVTKTLTATLLADMVVRGEVTLETPVGELLPAEVSVPSKDDVAIALLDLATHRSGLPRLPANFEPADPYNPYADYGVATLYDRLAKTTLSRRPGGSYEYSNLAAGLLGHALARKAGVDYERLLVERICKPLGMTDTRITLDADARARLAPGHDLAGVPMPNWDFDVLAGAGAVRSTTDDMLKYLAANLGLVDSPLAPALRLTHERRAAVDARTDVGLAWHIGRRTGARFHSGQTGGYHSFVAFVPDKRVGVVVLSNTASGMVDTIGEQLLRAMLGEAVEPIRPNPPR